MAVATPAFRETVLDVPLADIIPTPDNSRVVSPKDPKTLSLAESIRLNGVQVPALGRPHPSKPGKVDLRAGHRRHVAAGLAGLPTMPVIIREMTDDEALRTTILENVREPLSPIEEAAAIERMTKRGWTAQQIAETLGISTQTVAKRRNLLKLSPKWRKLLESGEAGTKGRVSVHNWPPAYFELIARLPENVQDSLIATGNAGDWEFLNNHAGWTLRDLEHYLDGLQHALKAAPWSLEDKDLVSSAKTCSSCPKRTSAQADLFGADGEDRCLDPACWTAKRHAWVARQAEAAAKDHKGLILIQENGYRDEDVPKALRKKDLESMWNYRQTKQGQPDAKPAFLVDGPDAGKMVWVAKKADGSRASREKGQKKSLKERLAALEKRRQKRAVALFLEQLAAWEKNAKSGEFRLTYEQLAILVLSFGLDVPWPDGKSIESLRKQPYEQLQRDLLLGLIQSVRRKIPNQSHTVQYDWAKVLAVAPIFGIVPMAFMEVATAEIKTPKSILEDQAQAKIDAKKTPAKKAAKRARKERIHDTGA